MATNPFQLYKDFVKQLSGMSMLTEKSVNELKANWIKNKMGRTIPVKVETLPKNPLRPTLAGAYNLQHTSDPTAPPTRDRIRIFGPQNTARPDTMAHEYGIHAVDEKAGVLRPLRKQLEPMKDYVDRANLTAKVSGQPLSSADAALRKQYKVKSQIYGHMNPNLINSGLPIEAQRELYRPAFDKRVRAFEEGDMLKAYPGAGKWGNYEQFPPIKAALEARPQSALPSGRKVRFGGESMKSLGSKLPMIAHYLGPVAALAGGIGMIDDYTGGAIFPSNLAHADMSDITPESEKYAKQAYNQYRIDEYARMKEMGSPGYFTDRMKQSLR